MPRFAVLGFKTCVTPYLLSWSHSPYSRRAASRSSPGSYRPVKVTTALKAKTNDPSSDSLRVPTCLTGWMKNCSMKTCSMKNCLMKNCSMRTGSAAATMILTAKLIDSVVTDVAEKPWVETDAAAMA